MQDRYAGDIGDFVKLSLLRAITGGRRLGVAWYRYSDETHNSDGRHVAYLSDRDTWRHLEPELFDQLESVVRLGRSVAALQPAFPLGTRFVSQPLPSGYLAFQRDEARKRWFRETQECVDGCNLVFADPDNGLVDDQLWRRRVSSFGKQIPLQEARALSANRCAVIYHHNSRFKGGHDAEANYWLDALAVPAIAVRSTAYSCRTFFILNPDEEISERAKEFCRTWVAHKVRLHERNRF